jgi:MarR family 2-MHQ and catechol resistance regulon transcriptional repressor
METYSMSSDEVLQQTIERFWEIFPPVWDRIRGNVRLIVANNYEITVEQFHVLRHIKKGRGSVSELAEAKHISRSAISQAIDLLVEKSLITRQQNLDDRRYVHLELTQDGDNLLTAIFNENRAWMKKKLASINQEELKDIILSLEILKKAFDEEDI